MKFRSPEQTQSQPVKDETELLYIASCYFIGRIGYGGNIKVKDGLAVQ